MNDTARQFSGLTNLVHLCGTRFYYKAIQNGTNGGSGNGLAKIRFAERQHAMRQHEKCAGDISGFNVGHYLGPFLC